MPYILQTDRLTKIIGEKELVRDVDLHVRRERSTDSWALTGRERPQ